ncbi:amidase signature domain-containing protein [Aspergillus pseudocaelatus]|uniref:amidase n=1 Tax=Aspergillus pseudocaelatus TaxID=1825620 RepID=A0ABQ6WRN2_9EURO|nr:amidase signature domain-containing protein [Aspergillus pseudocaelatus]
MSSCIGADWESRAAKCREILEQSLPKSYLLSPDQIPPASQTRVIDYPRESGILSEKELLITDSTAAGLVSQMGSRTWTAEEVMRAFLKRATMGQQLINFATEFLAESALAQARRLDQIFKETGKIVGPLHGVPISAKEHVGMKGRVCNAGFVSWCDHVSPDDAYVVQFLQNAGAIVHVRTNEPQSLMHVDSANNITGRTLNPWNRNLSPGGSSGGESASVSFGCSPLGIGSDMGGSIRMPAAFTGVYGLRPTAARLPLAGLKAAGLGQQSLPGVVGPLARSLEDLELFMKSILDQEPWRKDASLTPVPWRSVRTLANLTIGILKDDGIVRPHPPVSRAIKIAEDKLRAAGVNVVEWEPFQHREIYDLVNAFFAADGFQNLREALEASGEPILPLTNVVYGWGKEMTVYKNWELNYQREVFRAQYHELMKLRGVDVILSPAYPGVAPEHETGTYIGYTSVWNALDHPAVIIPTGMHVDPSLDPEDSSYVPRNELDAAEHAKYSVHKFKDAPIALQLIGPRFGDEMLLAAAGCVEKSIKSP